VEIVEFYAHLHTLEPYGLSVPELALDSNSCCPGDHTANGLARGCSVNEGKRSAEYIWKYMGKVLFEWPSTLPYVRQWWACPRCRHSDSKLGQIGMALGGGGTKRNFARRLVV
jgi:hypothetical protein